MTRIQAKNLISDFNSFVSKKEKYFESYPTKGKMLTAFSRAYRDYVVMTGKERAMDSQEGFEYINSYMGIVAVAINLIGAEKYFSTGYKEKLIVYDYATPSLYGSEYQDG